MQRINKVCKYCNSPNISIQANTEWNTDLQDHVITDLYDDKCYCTVCEGEQRVLEIELETLVHLSMSDLLKKSAKQLCFLRKNEDQKKPPSTQMIEGDETAHAKATSKYIEMRGTYKPDITITKDIGQFLMHYAFDEIHVNDKSALFIEHKNVKDPDTVETWYLHSSLLQTAVYQALVKKNPNRNLYTATFHVKDGSEKQHLELKNLYENSQLHIGDDKYTVLVTNPQKLIDFYIKKAIASFNYQSAEAFDDKYKFHEYAALKDCFTFRPINDE